MNAKIKKALKKVAPSISFSVFYTIDHNFRWDGDGPDPVDEGFDAYDVDVYARTVVDGDILEGRASLGGTYEKPGTKDPDIGGYLPQMLEEAVDELLRHGGLPANIVKDGKAAQKFLKAYMKHSYAKQMKGRK